MNCIKCGNDRPCYHFRALRVETLHVRDVTGEHRVQALGDFEEFKVCTQCAEAKYGEYMNNDQVLKKTSLPFGLMILAGIVIALVFCGELPILVFGVGMAICGMTCLYGNLRNRTAKKRELSALPKEQALYRCAWECVLGSVPKKNDVNDISYIPVDAETLARKNGDLMILYDLLPEIAVEAHKRIHGE